MGRAGHPRCRVNVDLKNEAVRIRGVYQVVNCPANSDILDETETALAHYIGIAGIGEDAPDLTIAHERAGVFGNDRIVRLKDLRWGSAQTLFAMETRRVGPWTANGWPTVRGTSPDAASYFGAGGPFASHHVEGSNGLLADASVQFFTVDTPNRVIDTLAALGPME